MRPDPIGLDGGINLFIYAKNNPTNSIDPHGLFDIKSFARDFYYGQTDEIISQFDSMRRMSNLPDWATSWQTSLLQSGLDAYGNLLFGSMNECIPHSKSSAGYWSGRGVVFALSILVAVEGAAAKGKGLWKITQEGTDKIAKHRVFGNFYRHGSTKLWWSKDITGHGGSKWKVFKETNRGLKWIADADEYGNFIFGKHKSTTGQFIPWSLLGGK